MEAVNILYNPINPLFFVVVSLPRNTHIQFFDSTTRIVNSDGPKLPCGGSA